ncbi:MAG: hypothetical protein HRT45_19500, partial [Bdellovibrionales bacterium]|nr:hypothetical protein [Bdellovibrionales bacterium]
MPKLFKLFCVLFFFNSLVHTEVGLAQQLGAPYVGETQIQNGPAEPSPPGEYTSPLPLAEALNCAHSVDRLLSESRLYVLPDSRRDDQNFRGNSDRFQPITFIPMSQEGERGVMGLEYD